MYLGKSELSSMLVFCERQSMSHTYGINEIERKWFALN